ncbi:MAG: hypothetical protein KDD70_09555 [Bdellovibrionales bacterium]|nr:hypothetical protein [Bdellovibrionales bacterium]
MESSQHSAQKFIPLILTIALLGFAFSLSIGEANLFSPSDGKALLVSHLYHNAFFPFQGEPILSFLGMKTEMWWTFLVLFSVGCVALRAQLFPEEEKVTQIGMGSAMGVGIAIIFRDETILLHSVLWLPYLFACGLRVYSPEKSFGSLGQWIWIGLLALFSWRLSNAAGVCAAPFAVLAALFLVWIRPGHRSLLPIFAVVLPAVAVLLAFPEPPWPHYPPFAQIIRNLEASEIIRPLIGFAPGLPCVDRSAVFTLTALPALLLFLLSLISCIIDRERLRSVAGGFSLFLTGAVLIDVWLPYGARIIGPLATFERILPLAGLFPLATVAVPVSLIFLLSRAPCLSGSLCTLLVVLGSFFAPKPLSLDATRIPYASPSAELYSVYGEAQLSHMKEALVSSVESPAEYVLQATASRHEEQLHFLFDGVLKSRWGVPADERSREDFVSVQLKESKSISGVVLELGPYQTDFPKGLRVRTSENCELPSENWEIAIEETPWVGNVGFTKEGAPYWLNTQEIRLVFTEEKMVRCFQIELTKPQKFFDWSIGELRLLISE